MSGGTWGAMFQAPASLVGMSHGSMIHYRQSEYFNNLPPTPGGSIESHIVTGGSKGLVTGIM